MLIIMLPTDAVCNDQSMFLFTILEKNQRLKFSQVSVTVLKKMTNYQEPRVKLTIHN